MSDLPRFVNVTSDLLKINFISCVLLIIRIADQILWHNSVVMFTTIYTQFRLFNLCSTISIGLLYACAVKLRTFGVERVSGAHIPHVA